MKHPAAEGVSSEMRMRRKKIKKHYFARSSERRAVQFSTMIRRPDRPSLVSHSVTCCSLVSKPTFSNALHKRRKFTTLEERHLLILYLFFRVSQPDKSIETKFVQVKASLDEHSKHVIVPDLVDLPLNSNVCNFCAATYA